ncbi:MAG: LLM class flavin-dependent oxidoreductase [Nakamurella sp.]
MKYGVTIRLDRPLTEVAELARRAEGLGFDGVWLADHYFARDAVSALTLMADRTSTVTIGTAVVSPFLRHPALLASTAATLQELSDGRFVLGLGPGGFEFGTQLGMHLRRPLGATREAAQIARALQVGTVDVAGQTFSTTGARLHFGAEPSPIYLAARGPKMLELAGEISDGVITHGLAPSHLRYVREHLAAGGPDRPVSLALMLDVQIDADRGRAVDALRPRCITMAGGSYADELIEVYGLDREPVMALRAAVRAGHEPAAIVTDEMVDGFCVAGPAGHVAERMVELAEYGADEVILSVSPGDLDECTHQLTELAKAVVA